MEYQCLSAQLYQRIIPVAPVGVFLPIALADRLTVMSDMVTDLQQQGNGELTDRGGTIGWNGSGWLYGKSR